MAGVEAQMIDKGPDRVKSRFATAVEAVAGWTLQAGPELCPVDGSGSLPAVAARRTRDPFHAPQAL